MVARDYLEPPFSSRSPRQIEQSPRTFAPSRDGTPFIPGGDGYTHHALNLSIYAIFSFLVTVVYDAAAPLEPFVYTIVTTRLTYGRRADGE